MSFRGFLEAWFFGKSKYPQPFYVFPSPPSVYSQSATWIAMHKTGEKGLILGRNAVFLVVHLHRSLASPTQRRWHPSAAGTAPAKQMGKSIYC